MYTSAPILSFDAELIGPWVSDRTGGAWVSGRGTAIGSIRDGQIVAGVLYEDYTGTNVVCHIAGEGNWATRRFLSVIFDYPFRQLGVKRITAPVQSTNTKSIELVNRMGFTLESTLAQAIPDGDLHLFRMWCGDCKYLRGRYALS